MDFSAFDTSKIDEYAKQAKAKWGETETYKQFEKKSKNRTKEDEKMIAEGLLQIFDRFGKIKNNLSPEAQEVQEMVQMLCNYLTDHYYDCTPEILRGLGSMYGGGGSMTENIDKRSGQGTGAFTQQTIEIYCDRLS